MLLDLNKEYLNDMGIAMMGDIISILKHAKVVSAQVTNTLSMIIVMDSIWYSANCEVAQIQRKSINLN